MDTIFWLAVIGFGAYFLFFRKRSEPSPPPYVPIEDVDDDEPTPVRELTPEEAEIAKAREVGEAGSEARNQAYQEHKDSLRDAESKLAQAGKFVRESGLDVAVPWLFDDMQHWPSWLSKSNGWQLPVDISEVEGGGSFNDRWVAWKYGDRKFRLHFKKQDSFGYNEDREHADFKLDADGEPVLKISCSRDWTKEFDDWRYFGVDVLKVGPWISELIAFYQEARLASEKKRYEFDSEYTLGRAKGIEMGEPDASA